MTAKLVTVNQLVKNLYILNILITPLFEHILCSMYTYILIKLNKLTVTLHFT